MHITSTRSIRLIFAAILAVVVAFGYRLDVRAQITGGPESQAPLAQPVLIVTKTAQPTSLKPGDQVTYTVTIENQGDGTATNVQLTDVLPIGFLLKSTGQNVFTYTFPNALQPGNSAAVSYTAEVANDLDPGSYVNVASVTALGLDPVVARATVDVLAPTDSQPAGGSVLGASDILPSTGVGQLDVFLSILGSGLTTSGVLGLRHLHRPKRRRRTR